MSLNRYTVDHHAGMTLLEVMVALAIFAVAAVAITKSLSEQIANMPILEERTYAQWIASNIMVDARLELLESNGTPPKGRQEGELSLADRDWFWRKELVKTTDNDFRMLRVSVSDEQSFERIKAQLSSYVLLPTPK